MPHAMTQRGNQDNIVTYTHWCDTKADMADIPEDTITLGTICVVLEDESSNGGLEFYIAKSNKTWVKA